MQYRITNNNGLTCTITLIPDDAGEENVINNIRDEFTLYTHWQAALKKISPFAEFVEFLNMDGTVNPARVKYQIVKGIGV